MQGPEMLSLANTALQRNKKVRYFSTTLSLRCLCTRTPRAQNYLEMQHICKYVPHSWEQNLILCRWHKDIQAAAFVVKILALELLVSNLSYKISCSSPKFKQFCHFCFCWILNNTQAPSMCRSSSCVFLMSFLSEQDGSGSKISRGVQFRSWPRYQLSWLGFSHFPQALQANYSLLIGYDRFFPSYFQFINLPTICHHIVKATDSIIT